MKKLRSADRILDPKDTYIIDELYDQLSCHSRVLCLCRLLSELLLFLLIKQGSHKQDSIVNLPTQFVSYARVILCYSRCPSVPESPLGHENQRRTLSLNLSILRNDACVSEEANDLASTFRM